MEIIEKNSNEIKCPEDGKIEEFYDKEKGYESFPLNFALKNILEKHSNSL